MRLIVAQYNSQISALILKLFATLCLVVFSTGANSESADVQTPSPVIFLSDNLNEPASLGWCIDTVGRGFADSLHAHSCKPRGGDVQFKYDANNQAISSVAFTNKCITRNSADSKVTFGLVDCDHASAAQKFNVDSSTGFITPASDSNLCIAVGESIRKAGPFSSRDLVLLECTATDNARIKWTVRT